MNVELTNFTIRCGTDITALITTSASSTMRSHIAETAAFLVLVARVALTETNAYNAIPVIG